MSDDVSIKFPQRSVFDDSASTISSGIEPIVGSATQLAELGLPALLVGMWPTGLDLAAAIGTAFGVAAQAHQNHSESVQDAIKALAEVGKTYHTAEDDNSALISRLRSAVGQTDA